MRKRMIVIMTTVMVMKIMLTVMTVIMIIVT